MLDVWYEVDRDNRLCGFSANWDVSAAEAKSASLMSSRLHGIPLLTFISGDVSAMFIETMINSARVQQKELIRPYRCDSPTHRREMRMRLQPLEEGRIRVLHELVRETAWEHPRNMRTVTRRSERKIKRCSMCNDLLDVDTWVTQDEYLMRHPHLHGEPLPVYYGICPRCARRAMTR